MKKTNPLLEEINRTKQLFGYDLSKTLNEQRRQLGDSPPYDGIVNLDDLTYVNNNWQQAGDVHDSNDGIINNDDLTLVNNNWLQGGSCDAPTSLNATNITTSSATLNWGAVTNVTTYDVRIRELGTSNWNGANLGATTWAIPNLGFGGAASTYEWQVRSNCSTGDSDWSPLTNFDTLYPPGYGPGGSTPPTPPNPNPNSGGASAFVGQTWKNNFKSNLASKFGPPGATRLNQIKDASKPAGTSTTGKRLQARDFLVKVKAKLVNKRNNVNQTKKPDWYNQLTYKIDNITMIANNHFGSTI